MKIPSNYTVLLLGKSRAFLLLTRLLLSVLIFLGFLPSLLAQQSGHFTYSSNGTSVSISDYTGPGGSVIIPATINGLPVTTIATSAFSFETTITSVTIPASIAHIPTGAFESCTGLTSVSIPSGVTSIGLGAFYKCSSLVSVVLPPSVTSIASHAFFQCTSLASVTIPSGVTQIEESTFYQCTSLAGVDLPSGVTMIGSDAFSGCHSLTSVLIPDTVVIIGASAFMGCDSLLWINVNSSNPLFSSIGGVLFNKDQTVLHRYPGGKNGVYSIPQGVTDIKALAFGYSYGLTSVMFPSSVSHIETHAFRNCSVLTAVTFEGNAPAIGINPFGFGSSSPEFSIYFYTGANGFTTPSWNGYPTVEIADPNAPALAVEQPAGSGLTDGGTLAFGQVDRAAPKTFTLTLRNTGNSELSGIAITRDGDNPTHFNHTEPLVTSLAPGASTTLTVTYSPRIAAAVDAQLYIVSNNPSGTFDLALTGSSNANVSPVFSSPTDLPWQHSSLAAGSLNFTGLALHFAPAPGATLTLFNNLGGNPISGNIIGLPDGGIITTTYNGVTYRFVADYTGGDGNDLVLISQNPEITVEIPAGTPFTDGGILAFGPVDRGAPKAFPVTVRNVGDSTLSGLVVTLDGPNAVHFNHTALPVTALEPGEFTVFNLTFAPRVGSQVNGAIHIASNDVDEPSFDLSLNGSGTSTVSPVFVTPQDFPWRNGNLTASDLTFGTLTIHFAPTSGMELRVFNNTGTNPVTGNIVGLPDGGTVTTTYNGVTYAFVATYTGGDGNDIVLISTQPGISSRILPSGDYEITFTGILQSSLNLLPASWQDVTPQPSSPYAIPKASLGSSGFFRARAVILEATE